MVSRSVLPIFCFLACSTFPIVTDGLARIAFEKSGLVCCKHAVHLLAAHHGMLKLQFHVIDVLLEGLQKGEHVCRLLVKVHDLAILVIDRLRRDVANEGKVLLDSI